VSQQRIGVNRLATALTGPDPGTEVCRRIAPKVNWTELLTVRFNALLCGERYLEMSRGSLPSAISQVVQAPDASAAPRAVTQCWHAHEV
jgi:hypothetical protein